MVRPSQGDKLKRRRQKRTRVALPVKVSVIDHHNLRKPQPACTLDLAAGGVRLIGSQFKPNPGTTLVLDRGKRRVNFRVAWVGAPGTRLEGQIGLESMEPMNELWGVDLPAASEDQDHREAGKPASSGRAGIVARYPCTGSVDLRREGRQAQAYKCKLHEIGPRGCLISTHERMPLNTRVQLVIKAHKAIVHARGCVRTAEPEGMWLEFFDVHDEEQRALNHLLERVM